jgi:hypothetical protein
MYYTCALYHHPLECLLSVILGFLLFQLPSAMFVWSQKATKPGMIIQAADADENVPAAPAQIKI